MVVINRLTGAEFRAQADRLHPLYRQCFAAPPWHEPPAGIAAYAERLDRQAGHPGAYGFLAHESAELVAAIYGWPATAELDEALRNAVAPRVHALLTAPAIVVAELMVAPAFRRRGLARSLLARFIAGHPRSWLLTPPGAEAVALYESQGWIRRATHVVGGDPFVLFTREASVARPPSQRSACGVARPFAPAPVAGRPPTRKV